MVLTERDKLKRPCRCRCACQEPTLYGVCSSCVSGDHYAGRDRRRAKVRPEFSDVAYSGGENDGLDAGEQAMLQYQRESR